MKRSRTYQLTMRATRPGRITIPPSVVTAPDGKTYKTESITLTVRKGHVDGMANRPRPRPQDPFSAFGMPPWPQAGFPPRGIDMDRDDNDASASAPSRDSDLFIRASVDREQVYVGEQVTLSLYLYSRVDLTQVDPVSMPKLDGFWAEDLESPTTLAPEAKSLNGVPYRAYLLKRRALFPVKAGTLPIEPAEADVTTGFFFAGRRVHRAANPLSIKVKPLPSGAPAGFSEANVGKWKVSIEASPTQVELGSPVTVRVTAEGQGNVRGVALPKLSAPGALRVYDPTSSEKVAVTRGKVTGRRTQEYLVVAQQTGTFTLPSLTMPYFDPELNHYEVSRTDPLTLTVRPGVAGVASIGGPAAAATPSGPRNVLNAGGLRPLRYQPTFVGPRVELWRRPVFLAGVAAPPTLLLALGLLGLVRGRLSREDADSLSKKKTRAARGRLSQAERLKATGAPAAFYGEVERALMGFMEAKLGVPVGGLTREGLDARLRSAGIADALRARVRRVLDVCDIGRFAPGAPEAKRDALLEVTSSIMEGWER
jgi:hypothetical protein